MRPRRNCCQVYHISKGGWIVSLNMGYVIHFSYTTMMNVFVRSLSKMEPLRSLIWRANKNHTNVLTPCIDDNVYLLPYDHMNYIRMINLQVCEYNVNYDVACGLIVFLTNVVYNNHVPCFT
jgi:hypothetical protein